jgi:hypothetical protein
MKTVTERALVGRINRRLARDEGGVGYARQIRKSTARHLAEFRRHYTTSNNQILDWHVKPIEWAREMNLLGHDEAVA